MIPPPQPWPRRHLVLVLGAVYWAWALTATHWPSPPPLPGRTDLLAHAIGYALSAGLFWLVLRAYGRSRRSRLKWLLLVMPLYAAMDEITQPWFGRGASPDDWLADLAGVAAAWLAMELTFGVLSRGAGRGDHSS